MILICENYILFLHKTSKYFSYKISNIVGQLFSHFSASRLYTMCSSLKFISYLSVIMLCGRHIHLIILSANSVEILVNFQKIRNFAFIILKTQSTIRLALESRMLKYCFSAFKFISLYGFNK